jgi:hypothetical protein
MRAYSGPKGPDCYKPILTEIASRAGGKITGPTITEVHADANGVDDISAYHVVGTLFTEDGSKHFTEYVVRIRVGEVLMTISSVSTGDPQANLAQITKLAATVASFVKAASPGHVKEKLS